MYRATPKTPSNLFSFQIQQVNAIFNQKWRMSLWFLKTSKTFQEHQHCFKATVASHLSMNVSRHN